MNFWNKHGLLNGQSCEITANPEENCLLFSAEYLLLMKKHNIPYENFLAKFINYVELCRVREGFFNQFPGTCDTHEKYMSLDNLVGIVSVSKEFNLGYHHEIWKALKTNFGTYDNVLCKTNFKRIQHPREIIYIGHLAGNFICTLLLPLLWIIQLVSCIQKYKYRGGDINSDSCEHKWVDITETEVHCRYCGLKRFEKTDGKILAWVRNETLGWLLSNRIYEKFINHFTEFKTWKDVFYTYFQKKHPIRKFWK